MISSGTLQGMLGMYVYTLCSAQCTCGRLKSCNVIKTTKLGEHKEKEKEER